MDDQQVEIERLRGELAALTEAARRNEDIFRRSHERYMSLLQANSLGDLFDAMIRGLRAACELDVVTLVIRDVRHEVRQLLEAEHPNAQPPPDVLFVEALEGLAPQYKNLWQPWLGPSVGADLSLVFPGRPPLASCALLPLRRYGELIGCLNFGSEDPERFVRGDAVDFLAHLADVAAVCLENVVNRSRLVRSGITDVLTGLYNRRYLQYRLVDELARSRREKRPLSCVMLDVDHFKPVNDRWGHPAGDKVLAQIAHVIREECRDCDIPVRYGGEEFAVLLPGADTSQATAIAGRIRAAVERGEFVLPGGHCLTLTVSAGVSCAQPGKSDEELKPRGDRLIAEADVQLYRAKSEGRNRVCGEAA
jgi:two-component system, cell cycle response regulator